MPRLASSRAAEAFTVQLAALEARGARRSGVALTAPSAKSRAAEAVGAHDAGSLEPCAEADRRRLTLLDNVESRASQNLTAQLTTGDRALAAGQAEVARQACTSRRVGSIRTNKRATEGLQRVRSLGGVLPLLADGENAEAAK